MINFLHGQDVYRSRQELRRIIQEYKKTNKDWLDFIRIDCRENNIEIFEEIRKSVDNISMFNQNKLIVVENIFDFKEQDELIEFLKKKDLENINIVFWDEKPDKRSKLFKFLQKKSKEFKPLQEPQLKKWIKDYIDNQKGKIESQALDKLIEYVGSDLWRLSNEINKLILYKIQNTRYEIQIEDVELLVKPEIDLNIFNLVDALGYKDKNKALKLFKQYLEKGEDENYLLSMFIYQIRNLVKTKSLLQINTNIDSRMITNKLGMHPYVAQKCVQQARNFSWDELKKIYYHLLVTDLDIKTGRSDITTALEMFLATLY